MRIGNPVDDRLPWIRLVHDLDAPRAVSIAGARLREMRRTAERLGDDLREGSPVVSVRTLPLQSFFYPTRNAFNTAVPMPWPYVVMTHRCLLVQVLADGELKNILFNPSDTETAKETPFFRRLIDRYGGDWLVSRMVTTHGSVESGLTKLGLTCADIDLIAFDHFHTQDLRPLLGTGQGVLRKPARFPNAYLLAPRCEWLDWDDLHPMQRAWFIADGKKGLPEERVVLTDGDLRLGDGCLLLRTPGHTVGNQTIFVHGDDGVFGCSENGTSADCYSPHDSAIPGLAAYARQYEVDVIINSNTPEHGGTQYESMLLERAVVDRAAESPAFVQMFPSSEVTPSTLAPGIRPSMIFGERSSGSVQHRTKSTHPEPVVEQSARA